MLSNEVLQPTTFIHLWLQTRKQQPNKWIVKQLGGSWVTGSATGPVWRGATGNETGERKGTWACGVMPATRR